MSFQIAYKAARAAGFRGASLVTALAIARAESNFDPGAVGDVILQTAKWGPSLGLWQIRSLNPQYLALEPVRDPNRLTEPFFNARAAYAISDGGRNFSPWATHLSKVYLQYMAEVSRQIPAPTLAVLVVSAALLYALKRR